MTFLMICPGRRAVPVWGSVFLVKSVDDSLSKGFAVTSLGLDIVGEVVGEVDDDDDDDYDDDDDDDDDTECICLGEAWLDGLWVVECDYYDLFWIH